MRAQGAVYKCNPVWYITSKLGTNLMRMAMEHCIIINVDAQNSKSTLPRISFLKIFFFVYVWKLKRTLIKKHTLKIQRAKTRKEYKIASRKPSTSSSLKEINVIMRIAWVHLNIEHTSTKFIWMIHVLNVQQITPPISRKASKQFN